jgi:cell wall-associated NlpC family hydrolase
MALTDRELAAARKTLQAQAVAAYMDDGRSTLGKLVALAGSNPALADGYAQVVAGGQQVAIHQYQVLEHAQVQAAATLTSTQAQAAASVTQLRMAQQAAKEAQASEERTLSEVNGQLTALVTAAETQQAQTESQQEKAALAAAGDLPAASVAIVPATSPATATPSVPTSAPTTAPATASSPAPSPTSPSTTAAATPTTTPSAAPTTAVATTAAPTTTGSTTPTTTPSTPPTTTGSPNVPAPNANVAIAWAEAQIGKPYQWGGAGPNSFDCSGLVMDAWGAAGVSFPHLAQDQYAMTTPVSISQLLPGDLVFFGTPSDVYHVGIYVGGGEMVDAPETGQNVMIQSIYETDLLSGGRPA